MGYVDDLDPYFDVNMREAAAAGIHVGTYPVSYTHLDVYKRQVQYQYNIGTCFLQQIEWVCKK